MTKVTRVCTLINMIRFTSYDREDGHAYILDEHCQRIEGPWVARLAAYEDFGYLPNEMKVVEAKIKVEVDSEDLHRMWIDVIDFPVRISRMLRFGAHGKLAHLTVLELAHVEKKEFEKIRGMGKVSMQIVADELARFGITGTEWSVEA